MSKFAVVQSGSHQHLVQEGDRVKIQKILQKEGEDFVFDKVLLVGNEKAEVTQVGMPNIKGVTVKAKVVKQGRAKKVIVFRYKSKNRYKKKKGHRQPFTEVEIVKITD